MRVSYPLSLKVSLWLMLNLLLLAALGLGFFIVQGGLGWGALVAGPTGERAQSLFNVIAGEAAAASSDNRNAVLKRFGTAYGAEFFLFGFGERQLAGRTVQLPAGVRDRLGLRLPSRMFGSRSGSSGSSRDGKRDYDSEAERARRRDWAEKSLRNPPEKAGGEPRPPSEKIIRPSVESTRRDAPPFPFPPPEWRTGRFVLHAGQPAAYWIGMRVPFSPSERSGRPGPAVLVAQVGSLWSLLHLIGLQSWLLAGSAVLVLSVLFWLPLVHNITRSIAQLTAVTEKIAEGRFDTRVPTHRRDELGRLGESVNRMATRLDAHMTGQKRFLGDVAHELCSPLARLQMATGILSEQTPRELQATVADVREEVQQMSTLVNELLAFTKAGMQPRDIALGPVDLLPLAHEVLAREDAAGRITLAIAPELRVQAEAVLLARALGNLVRNALRYAGDAGPIALAAARSADRILVTLDDEGPGVPAADLDRLGEPFFRPEPARSRETGGVGLGLAIVRNSIAACRGEVRFSNRVPTGFRAELTLAAA
jgi:two-component system sensor histidine kinase CpxA